MKQYAPLYVCVGLIAALAFGIGIRVGSAHNRSDAVYDAFSRTPHIFHPEPSVWAWLRN